ncbi:MAG: hypothetical protein IJZ90_02360 [Clostridia bacterium]|nr:hypothetical protein [Clostridia bacterium]
MYTSDNDNKHKNAKAGFIYLLFAVFCAVFGAVYELFGHGVYSYFMLYAFMIPLIGGTLPFYAMSISRCIYPGSIAVDLYSSGIAALTVGSIFQGVLEIYGTTNSLISVYPIAGASFIAAGLIAFALRLLGHGKRNK